MNFGSNKMDRRSMLKTGTTALASLMVSRRAAGEVSARYNVQSFGATGDGKTLDTAAIQNAIDAAARSIGGTVFHPERWSGTSRSVQNIGQAIYNCSSLRTGKHAVKSQPIWPSSVSMYSIAMIWVNSWHVPKRPKQ